MQHPPLHRDGVELLLHLVTAGRRSCTRPNCSTNKVIRDTYAPLSATLLFCALTAGLSMVLNLPHPGILLTLGGYFGLLYLTTRYRNQALGLVFVFALTCFMGGFLMTGILVAFLAGLGGHLLRDAGAVAGGVGHVHAADV